MIARIALPLVTIFAAAPSAAQQEAGDQKAKKSRIHWEKDLDRAWALSAKDGRPVLAYFTFET